MHYIIIFFSLLCLTACSSYEGFAKSSVESIHKATSTISGLTEAGSDHRIQLISGDFNGDGWMDNVYISALSDEDWTIVLQLDVLSDKTPEFIHLEEHSPSTNISEIVLKTLPPGTYKTLCETVEEYCKNNSTKELHLKHDAILLRVLEASLSIIYWDTNAQSFKRIWLSD